MEIIITRAKEAISQGIRDKLESGGVKPNTLPPTSDNECDCSGFICRVLGLSRQTTIPFYKKYGGWIFTDSMVDDVNNTSEFLTG